MIARELHDPGVGFVTVTRVQVSPDLQHARVFYTSLGDQTARTNTARALERGSRIHAAADRPDGCACAGLPRFSSRSTRASVTRIASSSCCRKSRCSREPADPPVTTSRILMSAEHHRGDSRCHSPAAALRHHLPRQTGRRRHRVAGGDGARAPPSSARTLQMVDRDPAPPQFQTFPGVGDIQVSPTVHGQFDAAIVMECGDLSRTGRRRLREVFHHQHRPPPREQAVRRPQLVRRRARLPAARWSSMSSTRSASRLTPEIATHIYLAILTDTGGFHYSHITPRTFDICRRCTEAGAQPEAIARAVYDSSTMGRLRLMGAVLHSLEFEGDGRAALAHLSLSLLAGNGRDSGRLRRPDQYSAVRQRNSGGGVLQGNRPGLLPHQLAVEGSTST